MNENFEFEKNFSSEFMNDLADVIEACMKDNTDNIQMELDLGENTLFVDMKFKFNQKNVKENK